MIYTIATMDTKGEENAFVLECIQSLGIPVSTVDIGWGTPKVTPDVTNTAVAQCHPRGAGMVLENQNRSDSLSAMSEALKHFLLDKFHAGCLSGVIGLGGSTGTALIAPAFRALPIGFPKLLVSTVASGNTEPYLDCSDIAMLFSVSDIAGLNSLSYQVLSNAAHAIAGMAHYRRKPETDNSLVGLTMFGVTAPCVEAVRELLKSHGRSSVIFHAVGTGGRAMEKLVEAGTIKGVLDITTTEVADEIAGGIFKSGPNRFDATIRNGIPAVISVGALDMVNFGAPDTVPEKYKNRKLYQHNSQITLMRTNIEENRLCARWIAERLNRSTGLVTLMLPEKGLSALDAPDQPFHDPEADKALYDELESAVKPTSNRQIQRVPYHINEPEFSAALVKGYLDLSCNQIDSTVN